MFVMLSSFADDADSMTRGAESVSIPQLKLSTTRFADIEGIVRFWAESAGGFR
jgi:hypothetical protein